MASQVQEPVLLQVSQQTPPQTATARTVSAVLAGPALATRDGRPPPPVATLRNAAPAPLDSSSTRLETVKVADRVARNVPTPPEHVNSAKLDLPSTRSSLRRVESFNSVPQANSSMGIPARSVLLLVQPATAPLQRIASHAPRILSSSMEPALEFRPCLRVVSVRAAIWSPIHSRACAIRVPLVAQLANTRSSVRVRNIRTSRAQPAIPASTWTVESVSTPAPAERLAQAMEPALVSLIFIFFP